MQGSRKYDLLFEEKKLLLGVLDLLLGRDNLGCHIEMREEFASRSQFLVNVIEIIVLAIPLDLYLLEQLKCVASALVLHDLFNHVSLLRECILNKKCVF